VVNNDYRNTYGIARMGSDAPPFIIQGVGVQRRKGTERNSQVKKVIKIKSYKSISSRVPQIVPQNTPD
jgi:hypothetical protein